MMTKRLLLVVISYCLLCKVWAQSIPKNYATDTAFFTYSYGAIVRGDSTKKEVALVFIGDEFGDGLASIIQTLQKQKIKGTYFFTGRFYRNPTFQTYIKQLYKKGNYLRPHSNSQLLYCHWNKRESSLVTKDTF